MYRGIHYLPMTITESLLRNSQLGPVMPIAVPVWDFCPKHANDCLGAVTCVSDMTFIKQLIVSLT